ncbi:MAG: hypothetical protein JWO67_7183 [Streptosporangiaceae bacterium]|nr:hypothetical protein [Streptosporangiaceae bacterium]
MALVDATSCDEITWFQLNRHEDAKSDDESSQDDATDDTSSDEAEETADADDANEDEVVEGSSDEDGLGDKGKRAIERMKTEKLNAVRELKQVRRDLAAKAKKLAEFEDADKSEKDRLADKAARAEERMGVLQQRVVKAEVRALAAEEFADPTDAAAFLDLSKYAGDDGEIDGDAIASDLADLLEAKPHLRKPAPAAEANGDTKKPASKPKPKADPGQGARADKVVDYRTADKAAVDAELSRMGVRPRR